MNKFISVKFISFLSFVIGMAYTVQAQSHTISGYVRDASNGETLIGATVLVSGSTQGVVTNLYGFYSITLLANTYQMAYRYVGFRAITKEVVLTENRRIDIELSPESTRLEEILITSDPEDTNVSGIQMSSNKLDIETITKIPAFMGEPDVLKSLQMIPGVASVGEGSSGFNVRGGSVGQNMILLDEAPIYNSSHLLGFFSVFNPDAVKDVTLIKGGIPARYGGRITSVLDIRMKEGNNKKPVFQGGIGSIFSRLAIEAPIIRDKSSFILAARRSYIDILAKPFLDDMSSASLNFYDITMKTNYNINTKNRVYLSGYLGRDNFKFNSQEGFNWGNKTATLRWNKIFSPKLFANFTFFFSDYDYSLAFGQDVNDKFNWNSRIYNYDFKPEFTYYLNQKNELSFGGELLSLKFEPANALSVSNGYEVDISLPKKNALETAVYVSNNQKIGENIILQYGLRYSNFSLIGYGKAYYYGDTTAGVRRPVGAVKTFDSGETIANYANWEPRFSVKYQLNSQNSFKASYNKTSQYIHLASNTTASNPLDVWTPTSNNIKPQIGQQIALGWFRNFGHKNNVEFSAEVYYRKTKNQIDYINGASILINEFVEGDLLSGVGRAYGLELYAKKNTGRFTGWISYTLARTELKTDGVNEGNWYPARYDQKHNFKLATFYDLSQRLTFTANFTFLTGTPTTFPTSRYEAGDGNYTVPYNYAGERNNIRIPVYHRLDFSAIWYGKKLRRNGTPRKFKGYWVFSVYNLLGRKNPFSIYFTQKDTRTTLGKTTETQANQVSIIGIFVPTISYNFKF